MFKEWPDLTMFEVMFGSLVYVLLIVLLFKPKNKNNAKRD